METLNELIVSKQVLSIKDLKYLSKNICLRKADDTKVVNQYTKNMRRKNKQLVEVVIYPRGKYRFEVNLDTLEGFQKEMELTEDGIKKVNEIFRSRKAKYFIEEERGRGTFTYENYASIDDAIFVAKQLANLDISFFRPRHL